MTSRAIFLILFSIFLFGSCTDTDSDYEPQSDEGKTSDRENDNDCDFENGTHSATVDYYNPSTGHSATYTLDVEVENCEVTTIFFENGGWLDDSHISPAELDSDGDAELEDDRGRTYTVHIDN